MNSKQLSATQHYLEQHHGGDGDLAAQRTLENYRRHHDDNFRAFWNKQTKSMHEQIAMADLGCGAGQFLQEQALAHPSWLCTGIECAPYMLKKMVDLPANAQVLIDDLNEPERLCFSHSLDLAMANMLIHELHQPIGLFKAVKHWLKPEGKFILIDMVRQPLDSYMTHNYPNLYASEREELEEAFRQYSEHNRYTSDDLRWMLELCGFEIIGQENIRGGRAVRLIAKPN